MIVGGEDEMLEVMVRHWEELGRSSEDDVVPDTDIGDGGGWYFSIGICNEVSWEEVLERGKAPGPDGILNKMVMYGSGWLVEVINLVMRSESCQADW